jgi:hypothetical protein
MEEERQNGKRKGWGMERKMNYFFRIVTFIFIRKPVGQI